LYVVLIVSFLGLVSTGLPLKYGGDAWARQLANAVGGFDTTRAFHHFFAVAVLFACVAYVVQGVQGVAVERKAGMRWSGVFFGLNSPLPTRRDFRDAVGMVRWFIGQGEKPTFERWTYWEKFDFWAIVFGVAIIGFSGLVLWFPGLASRFLPGATLNLAKMIHSELALAAGGFLFIIHVFNTHLRPEKFPVDLSLFTGLVSEEHLAAARPEFLERLRREGKLEEIRTVVGRPRRLRAIAWTASLILVVGLALLVGILLVSLGK
jgi:cytochrome b subunit of formate dehydrogenase